MADERAAGGPGGSRGAPPEDAFGRALFRLSEAIAVLGGLLLLLVTALTVASVVGRGGFNSPLLGDSEVVEVGCAVAIFAFLPYCQMRGANVIVDFFTMAASRRTRAALDTVMHAVFFACVAVLTWRLALGGLGAWRSGDNSMFLRIPLWWGYLAGFVVALVWCATCAYSVVRHGRGVRAGEASAWP
jgi:TRAP-type C4-dicarboxylate transport system permease small subunit